MSTKLKQEEGLGAEPMQVGPLDILALKREGWEFYQADDQSWIGEHDAKAHRTASGVYFTEEDAARAVLLWMRKQDAGSDTATRRRSDAAIPEEWYRKAPVPDDPQDRVLEDLSDTELQGLQGEWQKLPIAEAIRLELKRRDEAFKASGEVAAVESEESDDDWFLSFAVPGQNGRVMSDLTDDELAEFVAGYDFKAGVAAGSVLAWRSDKELAEELAKVEVPVELAPEANWEDAPNTQYRKFRAEAKSYIFAKLITELSTVSLPGVDPRKCQAIRDEMNSRNKCEPDENGFYDEVEGLESYLGFADWSTQDGDESILAGSINLLLTPVGWIYGYSWNRGKAWRDVSPTTRELFVSRDEALAAAVEKLKEENPSGRPYDYTSPSQAEHGEMIHTWASSLLLPDAPKEVRFEEMFAKPVAPVVAETVVTQEKLFDYSKLDAETAELARLRATEIRYLFKRTVEDICAIGNKLTEMKTLMPGHFVEWVRAEFEMSERTARNWMGIAREFNPEDVKNVPQKALNLLYAAPDEVKDEIVERAKSGETVTTETVKTTITRHREIEESRNPKLPGTETATVAADISDLQEVDEEGGEGVGEAEIVATGRTTADLVSLLKATPTGMYIGDITKMNFTEAQVEAARTDRLIEKRDLKFFYAWKPDDVVAALRASGPLTLEGFAELGCTKRAVEAAVIDGMIVENLKGEYRALDSQGKPEPEKPSQPAATVAVPSIEKLLRNRQLSVNFSYLSFLPGKITVSVCVGDDKTKVNIGSFDFSTLSKLPSEITAMITTQIERADKEPEPKTATVAAAKSPARKAPVKKAAPAKNATKGQALAKKPTANAKPPAKNATKAAVKKAPAKGKK